MAPAWEAWQIEGMAGVLDYDIDAVLPFVRHHLPGLARADGMRAIGWRDSSGELAAGVIFEGFNGANLWMHVAARPGRAWLTRAFLLAAFVYPFLVCKVTRVSGYINASNRDSRRFVEHLGFRVEATLTGAAPDGGDVLIYVLWRGQWATRIEAWRKRARSETTC